MAEKFGNENKLCQQSDLCWEGLLGTTQINLWSPILQGFLISNEKVWKWRGDDLRGAVDEKVFGTRSGFCKKLILWKDRVTKSCFDQELTSKNITNNKIIDLRGKSRRVKSYEKKIYMER